MKLKTRLTVAFFTIVLLPLMLVAIAVMGLGAYQLNSIKENYGIDFLGNENVYGSIQIMSRFTKKIHADLERIAERYPEKLEDMEYLDKINRELESRYSFLLAKKNEEWYYKGTQNDISTILEILPENELYNIDSSLDGGVYVDGSVQALIKRVDYKTVEGVTGNVYIITIMDMIIPQFKSFFIDMLVAIVLILLFTSAMLTTWIYRGISAPLRKLQEATQKIKEGDLNFSVDIRCEDEIGKLCKDFEEMRKRLRDSAEEKLKYDQENKELISNISHDLKTPITAIKGYVEGIMDGVADTPEKMDKYIRTVYNKANDMDRLINELTFYSKIDTNRIPYTFSKINVSGYFNDCIEEVGLELESRNIELQYFNYTDEDIQIIADAEQLKRVINNIVSNSIKYIGHKRGVINIRIKDVGDFIQVEIEDNGKGIAADDLPLIFERFYRTDSSRNSSQGGSGIGLSIVKKIIEDHGGKIWATSKEDIGTVMHFVIRKYEEVTLNE